MSNSLRIGTRLVGDSSPCLIIAEVGLAHEGSLGFAHAFIDAAAKQCRCCKVSNTYC